MLIKDLFTDIWPTCCTNSTIGKQTCDTDLVLFDSWPGKITCGGCFELQRGNHGKTHKLFFLCSFQGSIVASNDDQSILSPTATCRTEKRLQTTTCFVRYTSRTHADTHMSKFCVILCHLSGLNEQTQCLHTTPLFAMSLLPLSCEIRESILVSLNHQALNTAAESACVLAQYNPNSRKGSGAA